MQGLLGKKIGMTRMFDGDGKSVSVTVIQTGKNIVHQVKTEERDGYRAVQLGFNPIDGKKLIKPLQGHFKKLGSTPTKIVKEFEIDKDEQLTPGQEIGVELFENVKFVNVVGVSKGRGHAGTIKRYHFMRGRESHGNTNVRERGSVGANTFPARIFPGLRMSGHMGAEQVTTRNIEVFGIDKDAGLVFVKGAVPGHREGIVQIKKIITK